MIISVGANHEPVSPHYFIVPSLLRTTSRVAPLITHAPFNVQVLKQQDCTAASASS